MAEIRKLKNYINGEWVESKTDQYEDVVNPATKEVMCQVPISTREDVEYAVRSASEAFKTWSKTAVPRRARILFNYQQLLQQNKEELARLITLENGKNTTEALGEVGRGIENVEFAAGAPSLMMGDSLASIATDVEAANYRYPIGVVGGIAPFNFPMMVPCWMFPMAISLGNTFILKPSERTPLLTEKLAELFEQAGLPKGVFNVVHGAHDVVNGILEHPDIKAISFVGSKPVGEYVFKKGSEHLKRVQALTGAKNHTIVLNDAHLEDTVTNIIGTAFGSAGERCMACAVVTVEEGIADEFMAKLQEKAADIKLGNGLDDGVFLGPVIREDNKKRTHSYIEKGIEEGARLLCDGRENVTEDGYFVGPTIFDNVTTDMTIWKDEIFAPVLSVIRVKNLKEAVDIANQSEFANGACLFTSNANAIRYFRENIDAGMLGINLGVPAPMAFFPFSGWKSSFFGTLHANGKDSVDFYTRKKVVTARYPSPDFN
ncbi:methylmalonate-semialdehyde dehydrogenase [Bacillus amyloliquefaciens]|jgi:malonate-semialdehyde dehydrogenase (acetylating)/methylmalonate-semialdehyde dehydrogenase|uniref:Malonate-semialdehyde dehydrogenase n=1 Tax=Bacillus amyloliquefaciens (strain ATCC 23350 / DSM 7 / BCRC 11601 / CCUG 28519 / NBRC 15535 / NRRL B-14393 / F) TaxID=692420 RepID=A0A9P1JKX5_BACAS|nr:methylmalonate-semialdehyde dehydrogenase [Bacillus amyloliquefaciens]AZV91294.1 methylmalonate-semialdehyde dehydrogenase [Bacillus amyloliquefaciens]MDR4375817.1 CoA-acylating methylmalonate-semialdehyde dehydrogenase [Bacillus amyloliquefaciens]MEC1840790.1 methylmalonate-semialdehyde dehydrogenase [Bacillus amyloliquefaciens]MEC1849139.1 methylmalonate-semialdehyde dehydrogenase [Bacillus amyloliquefaciens]MEC1927099.1 methylmalonate-semialdehyde dehydrogenase [Bacillus amyloliquefacien